MVYFYTCGLVKHIYSFRCAFLLYFWYMAICDITDLGNYDHCDDVVLEDIESEILLLNTVTRRECLYDDGLLGELSPGDYLFTFETITYTFRVT